MDELNILKDFVKSVNGNNLSIMDEIKERQKKNNEINEELKKYLEEAGSINIKEWPTIKKITEELFKNTCEISKLYAERLLDLMNFQENIEYFVDDHLDVVEEMGKGLDDSFLNGINFAYKCMKKKIEDHKC